MRAGLLAVTDGTANALLLIMELAPLLVMMLVLILALVLYWCNKRQKHPYIVVIFPNSFGITLFSRPPESALAVNFVVGRMFRYLN